MKKYVTARHVTASIKRRFDRWSDYQSPVTKLSNEKLDPFLISMMVTATTIWIMKMIPVKGKPQRIGDIVRRGVEKIIVAARSWASLSVLHWWWVADDSGCVVGCAADRSRQQVVCTIQRKRRAREKKETDDDISAPCSAVAVVPVLWFHDDSDDDDDDDGVLTKNPKSTLSERLTFQRARCSRRVAPRQAAPLVSALAAIVFFLRFFASTFSFIPKFKFSFGFSSNEKRRTFDELVLFQTEQLWFSHGFIQFNSIRWRGK